MAIIRSGFQNKNENRNYPLHDAATRLDVNGRMLPNEIIADVHILIPESLGLSIFVSSVGVSSGLISVTFQAASANPSCPGSSSAVGFVPVAAVSIPRPIVPFKNYPLEALYPGVGGWISFGHGALEVNECNHLFDEPGATFLVDKVARSYKDLPIPSVGKLGLSTKLTGLVRLKGVEGATFTKRGIRVMNGALYVVGIIELNFTGAIAGTDQSPIDLMEEFAGVCGHRPIAGNCNLEPIISINDVAPDCDGNINIRFNGLEIIGDTGDGIIIDYPLGLADVCPGNGMDKLVFETTNVCAPYLPDREFPPLPPPFNPPEPSSESSSDTPGEDLSPVLCENFEFGSEFTVRQGSFEIVENPYGPGMVYQSGAGNAGEQLAVNLLRVLKIENPLDTYYVETTLIPVSGRLEGHLVFGYKHDANFFFAGVSVDPGLVPLPGYPEGRFFIGKRLAVGPPWALALGLGYNFLSGALYLPPVALQNGRFRLRVTLTNLISVVQITLALEWTDPDEVVRTFTVDHNTPIASFNLVGYAGIGCVASQVIFDDFGINCDDFSSSSSGQSSSSSP